MPLKTAIIGFGSMGGFHTQQIAGIEELKVIAAYDIEKSKVEKAKDLGYKGYFELSELLGDPEIEIVIVATPNNFHKELSIKSLKAGKHVICEKPAMMNSAELEEVIKISEECGRLFSVHQNRRWDRDFRIVKEAIDNNMIGKPFFVESRVQGSRGIPGDWRCEKIAGGGMLYDWGVHLIDQLLWLFDSPVTEIYAQLLNVKFSVDDNFKLMLKFENGICALVEVGTYMFINLPRWYVCGDNGTLAVDNWDCEGKIIKANLVEFKWEQGIVYTSAGPTKTMAPRPVETIEELPLPELAPDCRDYYRNFAAAVAGKEELAVTPLQSLRVLNTIDMAFESSKEGRSISCRI